MKKEILAKAIRLADKSAVRADKAVMAHPRTVKLTPEFLSYRLYTRIKPSEAKRLLAIAGKDSISALLRDLVLQYIAKNTHEASRKKK